MKKKIGRTFIIDEEFYPIVKQYIDFRPKDVMFKNFFAYFQGGKGSKQVKVKIKLMYKIKSYYI